MSMVTGHLDSATVYEVIHFLRRPEVTTEWTLKGAYTATPLLLATSKVKISAGPISDRDLIGHYGTLLRSIPEMLSREESGAAERAAAISKTRRWSYDHVELVRAILREHKYLPQFEDWLHSPEWVWQDHAHRFHGMFDEAFIRPLGRILEVDESDLSRVLMETRNPKGLSRLYGELDTSDDGRLLADAYTASSLLRAKYHDLLARSRDNGILHHPFRETVFGAARPVLDYEPSNVEAHLAAIALNYAIRERSLDDRIKAWCDTVVRIRRVLLLDPQLGKQRSTADGAINGAVQIAVDAGVQARSALLRETIDAGLAVATSIVGLVIGVEPWISIGSGLATNLGVRLLDAPRRLSALGNARRLRHLAQGPAGRFRPIWHT